MPRVATPIPNTYDSQTRPIAMATIRQVCALLSLPTNIKILFPGAAEQVPQQGSTLNSQSEPSTFNSDMRITAEVHEDATEERILGTAVFQQENVPFFVEPNLGVRLWPVYSAHEMIINFTLRAENRIQAARFRQEALLKTQMGRQEHVMELDYHYPIPYEYLHLLKHIHDLREAQSGYGDTFDKWVADNISKKATNLTTVNGTKPMLVIAEKQIRAIGYFDFSAHPQPESKENETGTHILTFEYHLNYDKVIAATAQYPLVVHNQLIDEMWFETPRASGNIVNPETRVGVGQRGRHAMDHIVRLNQCDCPVTTGVRIPGYDEWAPRQEHPSTTTLVTIMLGVDEADPTLCVDLKDLTDFDIDTDIIEFLKTEAPFLNLFGRSIVHISLYDGDIPLDDGSLLIDDQLIIRSNAPMEMRKSYHLRVALINDLFFLSSEARERFRGAGEACLKILSTLQGSLLKEGYLPELLSGKIVPRADYDRIGTRINEQRYNAPPGPNGRVMLTVGNFLISTHKRVDYADYDTQAEAAGHAGATFAERASSGTPLPATDVPC